MPCRRPTCGAASPPAARAFLPGLYPLTQSPLAAISFAPTPTPPSDVLGARPPGARIHLVPGAAAPSAGRWPRAPSPPRLRFPLFFSQDRAFRRLPCNTMPDPCGARGHFERYRPGRLPGCASNGRHKRRERLLAFRRGIPLHCQLQLAHFSWLCARVIPLISSAWSCRMVAWGRGARAGRRALQTVTPQARSQLLGVLAYMHACRRMGGASNVQARLHCDLAFIYFSCLDQPTCHLPCPAGSTTALPSCEYISCLRVRRGLPLLFYLYK